MAHRVTLARFCRQVLTEVDGARLVGRARLPRGRVHVWAIGKAAQAMAAGAERALGKRFAGGLVIAKRGARGPKTRSKVLFADHPVPSPASVAAAETLLAHAATRAAGDRVLLLISGGASSLLSAPVAGVSLTDLRRATQLLLRGGATIHEINTVRRKLGRVFGGRLATATRAHISALALSDVRGDDPATIGSGPVTADPTTAADALAIAERHHLPASVRRALTRMALAEIDARTAHATAAADSDRGRTGAGAARAVGASAATADSDRGSGTRGSARVVGASAAAADSDRGSGTRGSARVVGASAAAADSDRARTGTGATRVVGASAAAADSDRARTGTGATRVVGASAAAADSDHARMGTGATRAVGASAAAADSDRARTGTGATRVVGASAVAADSDGGSGTRGSARAVGASAAADSDGGSCAAGPPVVLARVRYRVLANPETLRDAAVAALRRMGARVSVRREIVDGTVEELAREIVERGRALARRAAWVAAGEPTVVVRGDGRGGRAQHLALLVARAIAGSDLVFAALGSDGTDGPTAVAGAVVDGDTWPADARGQAAAERAIARCDSYPWLRKRGALIDTGYTGTNLTDLFIIARSDMFAAS